MFIMHILLRMHILSFYDHIMMSMPIMHIAMHIIHIMHMIMLIVLFMLIMIVMLLIHIMIMLCSYLCLLCSCYYSCMCSSFCMIVCDCECCDYVFLMFSCAIAIGFLVGLLHCARCAHKNDRHHNMQKKNIIIIM